MAVLNSPQSEEVAKRVEDWKLRLIDLTKRNRAIYYEPSKTSTIPIVAPDIETIFNRLLVKNKGWEIWQPPQVMEVGTQEKKLVMRNEVIPGWSDTGQLDRTLRNLSRRSSSEYTERGVRILHITFGQLRWFDKESNDVIVSPILLTPVELSRESSRSPYVFQVPPIEDALIVNPALRLKLRYDFSVELPQLPENEELSPVAFIEALGKVVEGLGWSVEPSVNLGLFSFSKLSMYQDLTDNISRIVNHPILRSLAGVSKEGLIQEGLPKVEDLDVLLDLHNMYQILDADSSQQLCIQYALRGQSFVMQGPPGTGKSQTIANIISEYIAAGKSVLFVSEKMAALEVVYNRLKEKNLDEYCLELHSYKANKREVINELNRALTEHLKAGREMSNEEVDRLGVRRDQLNSYVESLHKIREPSKLSAYQLLNEVSSRGLVPEISSSYTYFDTLDQGALFELCEMVRRLSHSWAVVEEGGSFPWLGCKSTSYSVESRANWVSLLQTLIESVNQLKNDGYEYCAKLGLHQPEAIGDYDSLQKLSSMISSSPFPPVAWLEDVDLSKLKREAETLDIELRGYLEAVEDLDRRYDARFRVLPAGTADTLERSLGRVLEFLEPQEKGDGGLLQNLERIHDFVTDTPKEIDVWKSRSRGLLEEFGLNIESLTINDLRRLLRIAELCESRDRPERRWLSGSALEEAESTLGRVKAEYGRSEELRESLFNYSGELLNLDLETMINYFEGPGSSVFRVFRPRYHQFRSQIARLTSRGNVPRSVVSDLRSALKLRKLEAKIASERDELKKILGSYFGATPDFDAAERALSVAKEIMRITDSRIPKHLRDNLCVGTVPSEALIGYSKELRSSLSKWTAESGHLRGLLPSVLPNTSWSIVSAPLDQLVEWVNLIEPRLTQLEEVSRETLASVLSEKPGGFTYIIQDLRSVERLQDFEHTKAELATVYRQKFGGFYQGLSTDWPKVLAAIDWTRSFLRALPMKPSSEMKKVVTDFYVERPTLRTENRIKIIQTSIDELNSRFTKPLWDKRLQSLKPEEIIVVSERLYYRIDDLQTWVDYNDTYANLKNRGLGCFVSSLIEKGCERDLIPEIFSKSMYSGLLNQVLAEDMVLRDFRSSEHDGVVVEFRSLDSKLIGEAHQKVIRAANINKPQGVFIEAPDSEISILLKEAAKKRKQMPLRRLFNRIPNLVRRLKPCFLMSPISVSQFILPDRLHFDLVVFDEASQIFTEDAVGSIYRGDCLIVAGDNKQLPPTPFFQYIADSDDEWEEENGDVGVFDSVLDECMGAGLPVSMLRWHYRSRHDSLISFSNSHFYDNKLVLFPSSIHRDSGLGVKLVHVSDGVYDRGGTRSNEREAQVVADLIFRHFEQHPDKSLGAVTFSISQMNRVKDEIEARLISKPGFEKVLQEDRLRGFFVKNLENVQGDERDVMIISVGYGFDADGKLTMNFGPLNRVGGERRLNVAVTRAREKVIVVSSIRADDIDVESTTSVGVHCLHDYLKYAEEGVVAESRLREREAVVSIEEEVAEEVSRLGYLAVPRVGEGSLKVDIGVKKQEDGNRYLLGILLDGEYYRISPTSRDRDRLRAQVLESMGWSLHRVWSPEWVLKRSTELERLSEALRASESGKSVVGAASDPVKKKSVEHSKVAERRGCDLPGVETYRRASLEPHQSFRNYDLKSKALYQKLYRLELKRLLPKLVKVEGPIHLDFAINRLNAAVELKPVPIGFRGIFEAVVEESVSKGHIEKVGDFLWPEGSRSVSVRVPGEGVDAVVRPIEYIPPEEIEAVMFNILGHSIGLSADTLVAETSRMFSARLTTKNEGILRDELDRIIKEGKVEEPFDDFLRMATDRKNTN